jgi:hypothetical protein
MEGPGGVPLDQADDPGGQVAGIDHLDRPIRRPGRAASPPWAIRRSHQQKRRHEDDARAVRRHARCWVIQVIQCLLNGRRRSDTTDNGVVRHNAGVTKTLVETGNPGDHESGDRFSWQGAAMDSRPVVRRTVLLALVLALAAGCGGGDSVGSTTSSSNSPTTGTTIEPSTSGANGGGTTTPRSTNEPSDN